MKKILLTIFLLAAIKATSQSIPEQKQVRITDIEQVGIGKYHITGETMDGETVYIKYGFHGNSKRVKHSLLSVGSWLTVREIPGRKRDGANRSIITLNY